MLSRRGLLALVLATGVFAAAASEALFHATVYTEALMQRLFF